MRVLAAFLLPLAPLLGLQMASSSLSPHMGFLSSVPLRPRCVPVCPDPSYKDTTQMGLGSMAVASF